MYEKFIHKFIGDEIIKKIPIVYYNNRLYFYVNGVYSDDISILEHYIFEIDDSVKRRTIDEICNYIRIKKNIMQEVTIDSDYINFKNGLYDIRNKKLIPHNSNIFTVNQINVNYLPNSSINEDIERFLDDITCNVWERKETILQIIGYSFSSSTEFQKSFIFLGETAENGKSTLLEIINHLIGTKNICHISIHNLENGKFYASELENKLLNTVPELPRNTLNSTETFKSVVTADSISVEKKYQNRYTLKPYAKHIFTANTLPIISDSNNSYYRRLNILKFEAQFSDTQKKAFNIKKLITSEALEYLACISLKAYLSLLESRTFANEQESEELINLYKKESNTVLAYLDLDYSDNFCFLLSHSNKNIVKKQDIYTSYICFCKKHHYLPLGRNMFYMELRNTNLFDEIIISGTRYFKFLGFKV